MSRRHDQSYKLLFSLPIAIEHLINGLINADLAAELDFDRAENLATGTWWIVAAGAGHDDLQRTSSVDGG